MLISVLVLMSFPVIRGSGWYGGFYERLGSSEPMAGAAFRFGELLVLAILFGLFTRGVGTSFWWALPLALLALPAASYDLKRFREDQ